MSPEFLKDVQCDRCKGPLLAELIRKTEFIEESLDYITTTVWVCYCCGKEHPLESVPYFAI